MKRTSTTKSPRSLDIELHEARVFPLFTLAMPASEWCVFLIVSALFVFGIWLTIGEVRNWFNRRAELSRRPPSGMFKLFSTHDSSHSARRVAAIFIERRLDPFLSKAMLEERDSVVALLRL